MLTPMMIMVLYNLVKATTMTDATMEWQNNSITRSSFNKSSKQTAKEKNTTNNINKNNNQPFVICDDIAVT
jgi:hypothetical protein